MERRRMIIQNIPDFWSKVFVNHSQISPIICDKDEDILSCMTNLEVAKLKHPRKRFKIRLFFRSNPYFSNTVIVKEYRANLNGYRAYRSSPVKWLQDYMGEAPRRMEYNNSVSIFNWFVDHNFVDSSRIAEIIYKDIWLKPLPYYLGTQVSEDGMEKGDEQPVTLESFSFRIESVGDV
ncbi:testis-specific Y-encoded protein 1-like [Ochotona princeps]|uniref:testis-specific Y-encoded protein 1-like n=2 Tax=Ochotona princeps TaxID=9978 RepID=UPI0027151271|nr:testis-specific Y-encoded protein 1-like [Ochotona princeps]